MKTNSLKIAEKNLAAGIWTVETAQLFLKMSDEQPEDIKRAF